MAAAGALKHRTMAAAIAERLRAAVLDGSYPSGTPLRQDALAAEFEVSRIPVREALIQLESEGLVEIVPHKGAIVTGLSQTEVDDVFALRELLEVRLLEGSAPLLQDGDFARLDAVQAAFAQAIEARDKDSFGRLNAELHMALYARAEMPRTLAVVQNLLTTSERYTRLQLSTKASFVRAQKEHGELIALCRAGRTGEACALLAAHIRAVHQDLSFMVYGARRDADRTS
jgi:DNA-binding GntR family transcriptional regulator